MASGTETRQRGRMLRVRLTDEEHAAVTAAAERAGLTVGSYVRQVLLTAPPPRQVRRPAVERTALAQLLAAIGRVGGNINQLAHAVNAGRLRVPASGTLERAQADISDIRAALMRALGREP